MKFEAITEDEIQQCEVGKVKKPIFQESDLRKEVWKCQFFMNISHTIDLDREKHTITGAMGAL